MKALATNPTLVGTLGEPFTVQPSRQTPVFTGQEAACIGCSLSFRTVQRDSIPTRLPLLALLLLLMLNRGWAADFSDVFVNAGARDTVTDIVGREWVPDESFIHPSGELTQTTAVGGRVNASRLKDRRVPNEVLLCKRWSRGDLQYRVPVPSGDCMITLYFLRKSTLGRTPF
jgi:hypothetical protein